MEQLRIAKVWVDESHVFAETDNGIKVKYAFSEWPRLANATKEQREDFRLSYFGIHWPEIDEDLSFEGMFRDNNVTGIPHYEESACQSA